MKSTTSHEDQYAPELGATAAGVTIVFAYSDAEANYRFALKENGELEIYDPAIVPVLKRDPVHFSDEATARMSALIVQTKLGGAGGRTVGEILSGPGLGDAEVLEGWNNAPVAQEPVARPDEYAFFSDWYSKEAPDESEVRPFDMARHAWLAGMRFADLFPVVVQPAASAEPVGQVRHFHYSGVARNGYSQEAVLNDDAPELPDGTLLYATPVAAQAQPEPLRYGHDKDDSYVTGWNDCVAAQAQPKRPYNPSGSLSEYGVIPECDAQQPVSGAKTITTREEYIALLDYAIETGKRLNIAWEEAFAAASAQQPVSGADELSVIREAIEATFEQREGWMTKIAAAVRYLPDESQPSGNAGELPTELDALKLAYVEACEERDHLRAALAAQASGQDREDANMYWDADDPERFAATDLHGAVEYMMDGYTMSDLPMQLGLQCARRMPDIQVRVTAYSDAEGWQYEVIDAARKAKGEA